MMVGNMGMYGKPTESTPFPPRLSHGYCSISRCRTGSSYGLYPYGPYGLDQQQFAAFFSCYSSKEWNMIWIWIEYDMEYEMDFENSRSFVGSRSIYSFWPTRWHRWFWLGKQEGRSVIAWLCFMVFPLSKLCGVIQISKIHVVWAVFGVEIWRVNHEDSRKLNCKPNPFNYPNWPCGGWC